MSNFADILLKSNCVFTAAGEEPFAGYVAIADGKILRVGKENPAELIGPDTTVYELEDRTVSPGFSDVHCFFTGYSVGFVGADLSACSTEAELVAAAVSYASTIPAEKPILCHGWNAEAVSVNGTAALNTAFGDRPAILFAAGCETCWMNQAALDKYQFTPETCYPEAYVRLLPDILGDRSFIIPEFKKYMQMMNFVGL